MTSGPQIGSKLTLLDFLRHWAYHNYNSNVTKDEPCDCDVCTMNLIKWEDPAIVVFRVAHHDSVDYRDFAQHNGVTRKDLIDISFMNETVWQVAFKFSIRWFDGRSKRGEASDCLFQLYGVQVASKKDLQPMEYKRLMKAAVGKHVKEKHLKELKDNSSSVDLKHYQFCPPGVPEEKDTENITPPPVSQPMGMSFPEYKYSPFGSSSNFGYPDDDTMFYASTSETANPSLIYSQVSTEQLYNQNQEPQYLFSHAFPTTHVSADQHTDQMSLETLFPTNFANVSCELPGESDAFPVISQEELNRHLHEPVDQRPFPGNCAGYRSEEAMVPDSGFMHQTSSPWLTTPKSEEQSPMFTQSASSGSASYVANNSFSFKAAAPEIFFDPSQDFDDMTITPKANQQVFDIFLGEDVEPDVLEQRDFKLIKENLSMLDPFSKKNLDDQATEMKITLYVKNDADCPAAPIKSKNIASREGFRIVSKNSVLGAVHEVSKFGPSDLKTFKLPVPTAENSEKVQKCLKTFENSGMVFLWKHYSTPQGLSKVTNLCWRLYCYKICKGYPKSEGGKKYKVQRLPMCLKAPLREDGEELKEHAFVVVFDVLKMCAVAARLAKETKSKGKAQAKETHKKLGIYLGLKSDKLYDDDSLPVKIKIQNPLVTKVFNAFWNHGKPRIDAVPDDTSEISRSTFDSNAHSRNS